MPLTDGSRYEPDAPGARFRVVYAHDENEEPQYGPWYYVTTPTGWVDDRTSVVNARIS